MSDYHIYVDKDTGYFARISDRPLEAPNLREADSMPPGINYKWNGTGWTALTEREIAAIEADVAPPAPGENESETPGGIDAELIETINQILAPKDRQEIIEIEEENYDKTSWQQIPKMRLISKNLVKSFYTIQIEILAKVSKNNRDFEFALFVNGEQRLRGSLHIDFNRANDDKTLFWSTDMELEPNSVVSVSWRRVGNNVKCTVGRRKLLIFQHQATGLLEIPPQEEQDDWLFLGNGGIDFTHGNQAGRDIRYRNSMELRTDDEGIYFTGDSPFKSWVKFEFLKWSRGEGKTLKIIFKSDDACMVGLGSDEIQENSNSLFFNAELAFYLGRTTLISLVGNTGKVWRGTMSQLNKRFDSNYHRIEIENDGIPESAVRIFELSGGDRTNWDDETNILYEGNIGTNHTADSPKLMPYALTQDGSGFKIIAIQIV